MRIPFFSIHGTDDRHSTVRQGRWCIYLDREYRKKIKCEWHWWTNCWRIGVEIGHNESAVQFSIGFGLLAFWLTLDWWRLENWLSRKTKRAESKYGDGRSISIRIFDNAIWFELWADPMSWSSRDPRWWQFNFKPFDVIFGRPKYTETVGEVKTSRAVVPMPEGGYPCTVCIFTSEWKRTRWFRARRVTRATVTPDTPIPFPGKGENSWDCGEDATHSLTCAVDDPFKAVMKMTESVLASRWKNGGSDWKPAGERSRKSRK